MYGVLGLTPIEDEEMHLGMLSRTLNFTHANTMQSTQKDNIMDTRQLKKRSTLMKNTEIQKFSRDLRKIQNRTVVDEVGGSTDLTD